MTPAARRTSACTMNMFSSGLIKSVLVLLVCDRHRAAEASDAVASKVVSQSGDAAADEADQRAEGMIGKVRGTYTLSTASRTVSGNWTYDAAGATRGVVSADGEE